MKSKLLFIILLSTQLNTSYGETLMEKLTPISAHGETLLSMGGIGFSLAEFQRILINGKMEFSDDYKKLTTLKSNLIKKNLAIEKMLATKTFFLAEETPNLKGAKIIEENLIGVRKTRDTILEKISDQEILFKNYTEASMRNSVKQLSLESVQENHKKALKSAKKVAKGTMALGLVFGLDVAFDYLRELTDETQLDSATLKLVEESCYEATRPLLEEGPLI